MSVADYFNTPLPTFTGYDFKAPEGINYDFRPDFGGVIGDLPGLSPAGAPSPVQPGAEPGWGKQWADLFGGIGKLGAGLGAGIAAARGDMPMAGQLLSTYFQDKTGDRDESQESSLAKALRDLKESGIISFNLDTGDDDSDKLMI
jgi:hypothetical protein